MGHLVGHRASSEALSNQVKSSDLYFVQPCYYTNVATPDVILNYMCVKFVLRRRCVCLGCNTRVESNDRNETRVIACL